MHHVPQSSLSALRKLLRLQNRNPVAYVGVWKDLFARLITCLSKWKRLTYFFMHYRPGAKSVYHLNNLKYFYLRNLVLDDYIPWLL